MEKIACPLCNLEREELLYVLEGYHIMRCLSCNLVYLNPRPTEEDMNRYYKEEEYFQSHSQRKGYSDYSAQECSLRLTFKKFLAHFGKEGILGGRLLEVGCGYGFLLMEAESYFEEVVGLDLSSSARQEAASRGLRVIEGTVEDISLSFSSYFNVVLSISLFEHLYNPRNYLSRCRDLLFPGGYAVITTPNVEGFWARLMGKRWISFKLPEHIVYYSPSTLGRIMREQGFSEVKFFSYGQYAPLELLIEKLSVYSSGLSKILNKVLEKTPFRTNTYIPGIMMTAVGRKA